MKIIFILERHYKSYHTPKCTWGGCQIRVPPHRMRDHEKICKKRAREQAEGVARHGIETENEERRTVDTSYTLEMYHEELIEKLTKEGQL